MEKKSCMIRIGRPDAGTIAVPEVEATNNSRDFTVLAGVLEKGTGPTPPGSV
jgi:hypothetical protein